MFDRSTEIANQRRASYTAAAGALAASWRKGALAERDALFTELAKLCIDSNPDLYDAIEAFADAVIGNDPNAGGKLAELLERMRATAVWGEVRYRYIDSGATREALFLKIIES